MIPVDVNRVSAHVFEAVAAASETVVVIPYPVVAVTMVVTAMPGCVSIVRTAVIKRPTAGPAAVPTAIAPAATATAHQRPNRDPSTEPNDAGRGYVSRGVARSYIRCSVNHRRIVFGNINDLRVRRLNDNDLW